MSADIRQRAPDPEQPRVLKVRVPVRLHLRLHARRLARGESVSLLVNRAIEDYLTDWRARRG